MRYIDRAGLYWATGIYHVILRHVALADDGYRTHHFIVTHTTRRLDADYVVGTLVADNLIGGHIHQLDVLRHHDVRGHLFIDQNDMLGVIVSKVITVKQVPDIPHLH